MRNLIEAVFQTMLISWFLGTIYGVIIAVLWAVYLAFEISKTYCDKKHLCELESVLDQIIEKGEQK